MNLTVGKPFHNLGTSKAKIWPNCFTDFWIEEQYWKPTRGYLNTVSIVWTGTGR